jgi:hypothetical protein
MSKFLLLLGTALVLLPFFLWKDDYAVSIGEGLLIQAVGGAFVWGTLIYNATR